MIARNCVHRNVCSEADVNSDVESDVQMEGVE